MQQQNSPGADVNRIPLVCAADDGFAMPLAVAVGSAIRNLSPGSRLALYVLDGGISTRNRQRLLSSWDLQRVSVEWIAVDPQLVSRFAISGHVTHTAYFRLLMPKVLPEHLGKVIYLDCDTLVLSDLGGLWQEETDGSLLRAVQDVAAPFIDASCSMPRFEACQPYLAAAVPIANYRELGIDPSSKYFNSGVLVLDLARWREEEVAEKLLRCLSEHAAHVLWWDQYALNVVAAGRWKELDPRWNVQTQLFLFPSWEANPFGQELYERLTSQPGIVHFTSPDKPWHWNARHPFRELFYKYLDTTAWKGWRPRRPPLNLSRACRRVSRKLLSTAKACYRALRGRLPG